MVTVRLVAAWRPVVRIPPAVATPDQHLLPERPGQEELLLLVEGQPVLVCGNFGIGILAAPVVVGERIDGHVLSDAEDATIEIQELRQIRGVLARQPIHQMPAVGNIPVQADILGTIMWRILAPPLLVDEIPWEPIEHVRQLIDMMVDSCIHAKRSHANVKQLLQMLGLHLPNLFQLCRVVRQGIHVTGRAVIVGAEPPSLRPHLALRLGGVLLLVMEMLGVCGVPSSCPLLESVAIAAATPADTRHVFFLGPVCFLLQFSRCLARRGHVVHEDVHNHLDAHRPAGGHHRPEFRFRSRACV
mmetsp:Transcript_122340/g.290809  ORF Transcript_122340/g.290809 Transcript_122340/m.290809 type:complete len:301 (-) Transcript_122340:1609-2511(-)